MNTLKRNAILLAFSLFIFDAAFAKIETVLGVPLSKNVNLPGSIPSITGSEVILSRAEYVLSYSKERRSPNWVAWKLDARSFGNANRTNDFQADKELAQYLKDVKSPYPAVIPGDYAGSCFDRGHQIPSADRTVSADANGETFLMSNMVPQTPYLNRVLWEHLEQHTRNLVKRDHKKVYVIAGPIYEKNFGSIGPKKDIPVPSKEFKIIFVLNGNQSLSDIDKNTPVIAVILPNTLQDGQVMSETQWSNCPPYQPGVESRDDWKKYQVSLADIEKTAGVQLLSSLPTQLQ